MLYYFDTSFVTPLFLQEPTTTQVVSFMQNFTTEQLATSYWTQVEFASLVARHVRMQTLTEKQALQLVKNFEQYLENFFYIITPNVDDFKLATKLLEEHHTGLRGGDALHLAISKNHGAECFYTLDKKLLKAASLLNISAKIGIQVH